MSKYRREQLPPDYPTEELNHYKTKFENFSPDEGRFYKATSGYMRHKPARTGKIIVMVLRGY